MSIIISIGQMYFIIGAYMINLSELVKVEYLVSPIQEAAQYKSVDMKPNL